MKRTLLALAVLAAPAAHAITCDALDDGDTCAHTDIQCVEADGTGEHASIQAAFDAADAGDAVCLGGGTYNVNGATPLAAISSNGTSGSPITISPQPSETVVIQGSGSATEWNNMNEDDLPTTTGEIGLSICGDYIVLDGNSRMSLDYITRDAIHTTGDNVTIREIEIEGPWMEGIFLDDNHCTVDDSLVTGLTVEDVIVHHSQHGSGLRLGPGTSGTYRVENVTVRRAISYRHGYKPNNTKVPSIPGDPDGGGNSDVLIVPKSCPDNAGDDNLCDGYTIDQVIGWNAADDCYDLSPGGDFWFMNNYGEFCGPEGNRGIKNLREVPRDHTNTYAYNILNQDQDTGTGRGMELRYVNSTRVAGNIITGFDDKGMLHIASDPDSTTVVVNNVAWGNGTNYQGVPSTGTTASNYDGATSGTPDIETPSFTLDKSALSSSLNNRDKWEDLRKQIEQAFIPTGGSSLIDNGTHVSGVYCARADDDLIDPYPVDDLDCMHFRGSVPDQGPIPHRKFLQLFGAPTVQ